MTLLEITIVMVILAALLGLVLPNFGPLRRRTELRTSVRNIATVIRYARSAAIYGHRTVKVYLDVRNRKYWLDLMTDSKPVAERESGKVEMVEEIRELPERVYFDRVILYEGEKPKDDVVMLDFSPRGTVTAATIVLSDTKGRLMTVDIFGTTGAVEVYQGGPPEDSTKQGQRS
jgi:hypothetical protein